MNDLDLPAGQNPRELLDHTLRLAGIPRLEEALRRLAGDFADDLGEPRLDITSAAFVPEDAKAIAVMRSRKPGILSGVLFLQTVLDAYGPCDVSLTLQAVDGQSIQEGQSVATFAGSLRDILAIERTALNLVCHLSGVATLTRRYVDAVQGTRARICETRKTLPGLRALQKWACRCGGALPHRHGLFDAMLVKDNHLAHVPPEALVASLVEAAAKARQLNPRLKFVEVEVDTLEQLAIVLQAPVDLVLLDNMPPQVLRQAVAMRDQTTPTIGLEASGGVTLETVRAIAETGVDRISIGALTHSATALDLGLDIDAR